MGHENVRDYEGASPAGSTLAVVLLLTRSSMFVSVVVQVEPQISFHKAL